MGWKLVKKFVPPHICAKPHFYDAFEADISVGDVIECDCGRLWKCSKVKHESDQREGSSWTTLEWVDLGMGPLRSVPEPPPLSGIYAPGTR